MREFRGNSMAMIFQDPMTFLNPVLKIETQLIEPMMNHTKMTRSEARERALELMRKVGIPSPEKRITQYVFIVGFCLVYFQYVLNHILVKT
jgi:oligopeptide transport system ATP-binding protein